MTEVEKAKQTLTVLKEKQEHLIQKAASLAEERARIAFDAHSGNDAKARQRLNAINVETVTHASDMSSMTDRLSAARENDARAADREAAKQLASELAIFVECGQKIDAALAVIVSSGNLMEKTLLRKNQFGATSPNNAQLTSLGARALHTALMQTPWTREFHSPGPGEPHNFRSLVTSWKSRIASIAPTSRRRPNPGSYLDRDEPEIRCGKVLKGDPLRARRAITVDRSSQPLRPLRRVIPERPPQQRPVEFTKHNCGPFWRQPCGIRIEHAL
jgi:hypothetical protein